MRAFLLLLVLSPFAAAQPPTLTPFPALSAVEQVRLSERQQDIVSRDAGLRAMLRLEGAVATARSGYALYATGEDCSRPRVLCMVAAGLGPLLSITFPFASEGGLGTTRVESYHRVDGMRVSGRQAAALAEDPEAKSVVRLDEDGRLWAGEGASLLASDASADDCGHPRVQCGVVFEIETTLRIIMIGE